MRFPDTEHMTTYPTNVNTPLVDGEVFLHVDGHGSLAYVYNAKEDVCYRDFTADGPMDTWHDDPRQFPVFRATNMRVSEADMARFFRRDTPGIQPATFNFRGVKVYIADPKLCVRYQRYPIIGIKLVPDEYVDMGNVHLCYANRGPGQTRRDTRYVYMLHGNRGIRIPNTVHNIYTTALEMAATIAAFRESRQPTDIDYHGLPEYEGVSDEIMQLEPITSREQPSALPLASRSVVMTDLAPAPDWTARAYTLGLNTTTTITGG